MRDKLGQFFTSDKNVCKFNTADVNTEGKLSKKMKRKIKNVIRHVKFTKKFKIIT